jgi:hypothetical protein
VIRLRSSGRPSRWVLAASVALALWSCVDSGPAQDVDADRDGVAAPWDCDDADPALHTKVTAFADTDGDGVGAGGSTVLCTAGAPPAGYVLEGGDCAEQDPAAWREVDQVDRDGDGATVTEPTPLCTGATVPEPYRERAAGKDCDDGDPALTTWTVLYPDLDGDGVGARPRSILCIGAAIPSGWARVAADAIDPAADDLARLLD